jgi:hypothetical protein
VQTNQNQNKQKQSKKKKQKRGGSRGGSGPDEMPGAG